MGQKECSQMKRFLIFLTLVCLCVTLVRGAKWVYTPAPHVDIVINGASAYLRRDVYPIMEKYNVKPYLQFDETEIGKRDYLSKINLLFLWSENWRLNELDMTQLKNLYILRGGGPRGYYEAKIFINWLVDNGERGYLGINHEGGTGVLTISDETIDKILRYARSKKCL